MSLKLASPHLKPPLHGAQLTYSFTIIVCSCITLTSSHASIARFASVASALDYETQRKLYPELLKRLDDSNDAIRVEAARAFEKFLQGMAPGFEPGQMEYMVRALSVHLDDGNAGVQDAVQAVMLQVTLIRVHRFGHVVVV